MLIALFWSRDSYNAIRHRYDGFSFHFVLKNMLAFLSYEGHTITGKFFREISHVYLKRKQ